jgi:hypothetical protein
MMVAGLIVLVLAAEPACPPCAKGAECVDGKCQFICRSNSDCRPAHVCLDIGICDDELPLLPNQPRMIKRGDATHPSRFRYAGTVPPGFVRRQSPNWWGVLRGFIVFSVGYGAAQLTGVGAGTWKPEVLIPVAGPAYALQPHEPPALSVIAVAGEIGFQVVGLAMMVAGFALPEYWLEHDPNAPSISLVPSLNGASLVGRF